MGAGRCGDDGNVLVGHRFEQERNHRAGHEHGADEREAEAKHWS